MVTTIGGIRTIKSARLYSSGISNAIVKIVFFETNLCLGRGWAELCKSFHLVPESGSFRLLPTQLSARFARLFTVHPRQRCDAKSLEYQHKGVYPNGIHAKSGPPMALQRFPVLAQALVSEHSGLQVPRVAPPSNPLLQLTFCRTRLRSTGQFRLHLPSLPDRFCACDGVWPVRRETTRGEI
jgi:hypothetical protein